EIGNELADRGNPTATHALGNTPLFKFTKVRLMERHRAWRTQRNDMVEHFDERTAKLISSHDQVL
ncbi:MAG: hypothetical protein ACKOYI_14040, partial [Actinomycetota bacterium]